VCEWGKRQPWEWAASVHAQLWRTSDDIQDAWSGNGGIISVADGTEPLAQFAGPGGWNDPDMLVAGLRGHSRSDAAGTIGCSQAEYRSQVSLWAMMAAPLFISCDLRNVDAETVATLSAPQVLAVDQDPLGRAGRRVARSHSLDVWQRDLDGGAGAVAVVNRRGEEVTLRPGWDRLGGAPPQVVDCWTDRNLGGTLTIELEPHATALYRIDPAPDLGSIELDWWGIEGSSPGRAP
jgi:alpha-galactosidase